MATDPLALFDEWLAEARTSEINDPEAMALATADASGQPSVRLVLLKVRIEGNAERVPDAQADAYFATRARDSQLGAWASDQSRPLDKRETFEQRFEAMKQRFEGADVPRPPHWGGYRVLPERMEFWSDRPHRLHERRLFVRTVDGWTEGLLYP